MRKNIVMLFISFVFFSCAKNSNITGVEDNSTYLGGIGTQRTYIQTEKWLQLGTNNPVVVPPDSLILKVPFSQNEISSGVVIRDSLVETIAMIDSTYYAAWRLPPPREMYKTIRTTGIVYDLFGALYELVHGRNYEPIGISESNYHVYAELPGKIIEVSPNDTLLSSKPPWLKVPLIVGDSWERLQYTSIFGPAVISVRVSELKKVTIAAGTFEAYKLEVATKLSNPDSTLQIEYEYYSPNVGLILYETKRTAQVWYGYDTITLMSVDQVIRKELVSYSFVQ
ncbi:MAG: hypothetical protein KGJ59_04395 [Bacteroidota bacterium]|nr:hypothetical protein [Bacteroidota bacterium]